jgi:hypothetical protein
MPARATHDVAGPLLVRGAGFPTLFLDPIDAKALFSRKILQKGPVDANDRAAIHGCPDPRPPQKRGERPVMTSRKARSQRTFMLESLETRTAPAQVIPLAHAPAVTHPAAQVTTLVTPTTHKTPTTPVHVTTHTTPTTHKTPTTPVHVTTHTTPVHVTTHTAPTTHTTHTTPVHVTTPVVRGDR